MQEESNYYAPHYYYIQSQLRNVNALYKHGNSPKPTTNEIIVYIQTFFYYFLLWKERYCSVAPFNTTQLIFKHFIQIQPYIVWREGVLSFSCKFQRDHYMSFHNEPLHVITAGNFSHPSSFSQFIHHGQWSVRCVHLLSPTRFSPICENLVCSCDRFRRPVKSLQRKVRHLLHIRVLDSKIIFSNFRFL